MLIPFLSYCILIIFSGILIFFTEDKISQGLGYIIGMTVMVTILMHYVSFYLAFIVLIILIIAYAFFLMERSRDDTDN